VNPSLNTDGEISGTALGPRGKPISGLQIQIARVLPGGKLKDLSKVYTKTDASGRFRITELPHGDFVIGVNLRDAPTRETPYATVYYPGSTLQSSAKILHLDPARRLSQLRLVLPEPFAPRDVRVTVELSDGTPVANAQVFTDVGQNGPAGLSRTDANGKADAPCLQQLPYRISARYFIDTDPTKKDRRIMDGEVILPAGREPASLRVVLNRPGLLP